MTKIPFNHFLCYVNCLRVVSLEPPCIGASIDTPHTLWSEAPEAANAKFSHLRYFKPNQRYLWLPRSDMTTDGVIETTEQRSIYRHPPSPWWCPAPYWLTDPPLLCSACQKAYLSALYFLLKKRLSVLAKKSGSMPLNNGSRSGSRGPMNLWIRIRKTDEMLA
jgi:hypothetical protein